MIELSKSFYKSSHFSFETSALQRKIRPEIPSEECSEEEKKLYTRFAICYHCDYHCLSSNLSKYWKNFRKMWELHSGLVSVLWPGFINEFILLLAFMIGTSQLMFEKRICYSKAHICVFWSYSLYSLHSHLMCANKVFTHFRCTIQKCIGWCRRCGCIHRYSVGEEWLFSNGIWHFTRCNFQ